MSGTCPRAPGPDRTDGPGPLGPVRCPLSVRPTLATLSITKTRGALFMAEQAALVRSWRVGKRQSLTDTHACVISVPSVVRIEEPDGKRL